MLRARKPEAVTKRLKMFLFGPAGCGKTTAAIQFPNSYIIDCEKGTENYDKLITASGSAVFQTTDMHEVVQEVKALLTTKHDYRTLVIDPITTAYNDLLEKCEVKVGTDFGRHYGEANKVMKRLANLIMQLDMNVVVTAHAKAEYGENLRKLGYTFDGWRQLDYWFDLVVELVKKGKKRFGRVSKTRIDSFPDEDVFEWSYASICKRYDNGTLEKAAASIILADPAQVREIKELLNIVRLPEGLVDKWFSKAGVDLWEDMPTDVIYRCIEFVKNRLPAAYQATMDDPRCPPEKPAAPQGSPPTSRPAAAPQQQQETGEAISQKQQDEIVELMGIAKDPAAATGTLLRNMKVQQLSDLTAAQAEELLPGLRAKAEAAKAKRASKAA